MKVTITGKDEAVVTNEVTATLKPSDLRRDRARLMTQRQAAWTQLMRIDQSIAATDTLIAAVQEAGAFVESAVAEVATDVVAEAKS